MNVLLVEDHPINQQLTLELLRAIGVTAELAQDGQQALDIIHAHEPDHYALVLMDLQMPVLDGYEATKRLRADVRYARLPIIAMTAHVSVEERQRCLALGMQGHLGKPIDPDELGELVMTYHGLKGEAAECDDEPVSDTVAPPLSPASDDNLNRPLALNQLDVVSALHRTRGDSGLYATLLKRFVTEFRTFCENMQHLLQERNFIEAQRLAHTLKGVAGVLGARQLSEAAGRLEDALLAHEEPDAALARVEIELDFLLANLARYLEAAA
jgi:CheY-like chemotaxis protein